MIRFTINASKATRKSKRTGRTLRSRLRKLASSQARMLDMAGWKVLIKDRTCGQYYPDQFEKLLKFDARSPG